MIEQIVASLLEAEAEACKIEKKAAEDSKTRAVKHQVEMDEFRDEFLMNLRTEIAELEESYKLKSEEEVSAFFGDKKRHNEKLKISFEKNAAAAKQLILDELGKEF